MWFDGNGVPRYAPFTPGMLGVYDHVAVLVQIACQACSARLLVGEGRQRYVFIWSIDEPVMTTIEDVCRNYHYGDPPHHDCLGAGETMQCIDLAVLQAWQRNPDLTSTQWWVRRPDLEGPLDLPSWATL